MNNTKPAVSALTRWKLWRVRFYAVTSFTAVMTLCAPISPLNTPPLNLPKANAEPLELKAFAAKISKIEYGWTKKQHACLNKLWGKESAWNPVADNPKSTAFGIAQMLNEKSKDPVQQIRNGLRYISFRYDNPCNAWSFWQKRNYY